MICTWLFVPPFSCSSGYWESKFLACVFVCDSAVFFRTYPWLWWWYLAFVGILVRCCCFSSGVIETFKLSSNDQLTPMCHVVLLQLLLWRNGLFTYGEEGDFDVIKAWIWTPGTDGIIRQYQPPRRPSSQYYLVAALLHRSLDDGHDVSFQAYLSFVISSNTVLVYLILSHPCLHQFVVISI